MRAARGAIASAVIPLILATGACDGPVPEAGPEPGADGGEERAGSAGAEVDREAPVCAEDGFRTEGELASRTGAGDASDVGALRWQRHDEACERFVVDLEADDGGPADEAGDVTVEFLRELGVIRIRLPDVSPEIVEEADERFEGPLATAAFAVRGEDRRIHVDLHVGEPAVARALVLSSPARVVVDLRPGGGPVPPPAARDRGVVVLRPRPGREASYPLEVSGYARTFEANVLVRVRQGGGVRVEDFTTARDWAGTWGAFDLVIEDGPTGRVELFVGEESARDGTEEGVRIDLVMQ